MGKGKHWKNTLIKFNELYILTFTNIFRFQHTIHMSLMNQTSHHRGLQALPARRIDQNQGQR